MVFLEDLATESPLRCPGLAHTLDYERNVVTLRVPRSCVGNPAWVRLRVV